MSAPYNVTFLLDRSNDWIGPHLAKSGLLEGGTKYRCRVSFDHEEVMEQDIVFVLGYMRILGPDFLSRNALVTVVHESDLPKGKGFAPVQWQILEGKREIPICLLEAVGKADSGDVLLKSAFTLTGFELYDDIRTAQACATFALVADFLAVYPHYSRTPQTGQESFYPKRSAKDGELDLDKTLRDQVNLLRIGNNEGWPSYFVLDGQKFVLKIYRA